MLIQSDGDCLSEQVSVHDPMVSDGFGFRNNWHWNNYVIGADCVLVKGCGHVCVWFSHRKCCSCLLEEPIGCAVCKARERIRR